MEVRRITSNDELYHHGVKGQRWGVRRYQTESGKLTDKGKDHYNKSLGKIQKLELKSNKLKTKAKKYNKKSADMEFKSLKSWTEKGERRRYYKSKKFKRKAARLEYSAEKKIQRGNKIIKKMKQDLNKKQMNSLDPQKLEYAKKYANKYLIT